MMCDLCRAGRTGVLQLTAAKSRMGHAEPAAGQVGMVQLSQMLSQMTTRCMTHLRTVNHHISSLLEAHGKPGPAMLTIHAARADVQSSALHAAENAWERTASVSAFAFQVGSLSHRLTRLIDGVWVFCKGALMPEPMT